MNSLDISWSAPALGERTSASARALVANAISASDRVLVLGAGGWFGRTVLELVQPLEAAVMAVASTERVIELNQRAWLLQQWNESDVERFGATVVIDCAFLTRDRLADMGLSMYASTNRELTRRLITASAGAQVRLAMTVSSGAAIFPTDAAQLSLEQNPYGHLKREAESRLSELSTCGRRTIIARAWSVSGAHVQHPRNYALADMILQARTGTINVSASTRVFRRYVLADELIAVGLATEQSGTIDSGGELVEMGELAEAVRRVIFPEAVISRPDVTGDGPAYYSDNVVWTEAVARTGLVPTSLADQIRITNRGL